MSMQNSTVAVFNDHTRAERAIKELQEAGFDIKKLSPVGKTRQQEHAFNVT